MGETAWMVAFVDSGRLLRVRCVPKCHEGLRDVSKQ